MARNIGHNSSSDDEYGLTPSVLIMADRQVFDKITVLQYLYSSIWLLRKKDNYQKYLGTEEDSSAVGPHCYSVHNIFNH